MERIILAIAGIYFLSHVFSALFSRTRIPDVLLLTVMGLIAGPFTGNASREDFGMAGEVLSVMALVIILFEGGMSIRLSRVSRVIGNALVLTVLSFAVTALVAAHVSIYYLHFDLYTALLCGVILGGVSPAVIIPMAKSLKLGPECFAVLSIECAVSDVLAVVLALGLMDALRSGYVEPGSISATIVVSLLAGALIGIVGGVIWLLLLSSVRSFPHTTLTTLGFVLLLSAATDLMHLSGAISAFFFGLTLANYHELIEPRVHRLRGLNLVSVSETEHAVFNEVVFILKTFFFVYLGICISVDDPAKLWFGLLGVMIVGLLRILVSRASLPQRIGLRELAITSQMFPKGLAAAVLAGIPAEEGIAEGIGLRGFVYSVLLISIIWSAVWVPLIEKTRLGTAMRNAFGREAAS
jgi:NhaP-type Na+/H+ or K+/H+ antiporter